MNLSPFFEKELEEPLWGRGGPCSASHDPGGPQALAGRTRCPGRRLGDSRGPSHGRSLPPAVSRRQTGGQDHAVSLASVTTTTQENAAPARPSRRHRCTPLGGSRAAEGGPRRAREGHLGSLGGARWQSLPPAALRGVRGAQGSHVCRRGPGRVRQGSSEMWGGHAR